MTNKKNWFISSLALSIIFFGCDKEMTDRLNLRKRQPSSVAQKTSTAAEFVPASRQISQTLQSGYFTSGSVAGVPSQVVQTSSRGYKIYSSVQGVLISTGTSTQ